MARLKQWRRAAREVERHTLVLDAALELFGTRDYAKTSIELLCQTTGIGTNSFYDLFANKEAVLIGLYDQLFVRLHRSVTEAFLTHHDDPDLIRAMVSRLVHESVDDPRVARVAFIESAGVSDQVEDHRGSRFVHGVADLDQSTHSPMTIR